MTFKEHITQFEDLILFQVCIFFRSMQRYKHFDFDSVRDAPCSPLSSKSSLKRRQQGLV